MKRTFLSIEVGAPLKKWLVAKAKADARTISSTVRMILWAKMQEERKGGR